MADAIDDLEKRIEKAMCCLDGDDLIARIHKTIDIWRYDWGGSKIYVAKQSRTRRDETIAKLSAQGARPSDIAQEIGMSDRQVRRLFSKKSSYL